MNTQTKVKNLNECQKAYRKTLKEVQELTHRIDRALIDFPAAANGDWSLVGEVKYLKVQLKEISDRLNHEGEYAE